VNTLEHGTLDAYKNHACRCGPCREHYSRYNKRREYLAATGRSLRVSARGTHRRIRALMALGYGLPHLAGELGIATGNLSKKFHQPYVLRTTHENIADLYERLAMAPLPTSRSAHRTRSIGRSRQWASPMAWDDIDTDDEPYGVGRGRYDTKTIDEVTVARLMAGWNAPANAAERNEAMRRWKAAGNSERSLCERLSWKQGRYDRPEKASA
jgi:hypothetical protein